MENRMFLKQFSYTIPSSILLFADSRENSIITEHLPLLKVFIDFENGDLKLEGDWSYLMTSNKHNEDKYALYHRERVKINMTICGASPVNLKGTCNDGLVFPMEGTIKDGNCLSECTGLLVLDNCRKENGLLSGNWTFTFYLYDSQFDECEIRCKLPLQISHYNKYNN